MTRRPAPVRGHPAPFDLAELLPAEPGPTAPGASGPPARGVAARQPRWAPAPLSPVACLAAVWLAGEAASVLAWRGYADPDPGEGWPPDLIAELIALVAAGPCPLCRIPLRPDDLADHWLSAAQAEWEHSLPVWACSCGMVYKVLTEYDGEHFYAAGDDGPRGPLCEGAASPAGDADCPHGSCPEVLFCRAFGDPAGTIRRNPKGQVRHSDACPACGEKFAGTIARQTVPEGALF